MEKIKRNLKQKRIFNDKLYKNNIYLLTASALKIKALK